MVIGAVLNSCASIAVLPTRGGGSGWMRRPILQTSGMCCRASDRPRAARAKFHFRGHWALRCVLADAYGTCCELCFHGGELEAQHAREFVLCWSGDSHSRTSQIMCVHSVAIATKEYDNQCKTPADLNKAR